MKTLSRHKTFIKDRRGIRLTEIQAAKLFLYVATLSYIVAHNSYSILSPPE